MFLFTLLIDGINADSAWDIYFHLLISEGSKDGIEHQAQKLVSLSESIDQWRNGPYGSILKFHDAASLQQVRHIWSKYGSQQSKGRASFEVDLERSRELLRDRIGLSDKQISEGRIPMSLSGLRSLAPMTAASTGEVSEAFVHFWKHGSFSKKPESSPNPLFFETICETKPLHYGTDPLLGFHLATTLAKLSPSSPLRPKKTRDHVQNVVEAAKTQFREWVAAFQAIPKNLLTLRFTVTDALSLSYALQSDTTPESIPASNFLRNPDLRLAKRSSAPVRFDVIDTSNLSDHLGALNLLVAATPLLKRSPGSTLWIETLVKNEETTKQRFDALLGGHLPTMSILLGLAPFDLWTNATSVSCVDELFLNKIQLSRPAQQSHIRIAWKLNPAFLQSAKTSPNCYVEPIALAKALFAAFKQMFESEYAANFLSLSLEDMRKKIKSTMYPVFHKGSYAALIKRIQANISTDWPAFWEHLLVLINKDCLNRQELSVQLHLQGVHTENWLKDKSMDRVPSAGGFYAWENIPEVVCVTVVVPRKQIDNLYSTIPSRKIAPTLEGFLKSVKDGGWANFFGSMYIAFGHIETSGSRETEDFAVTVRQDPHGLQGDSPLIASFYVPSASLYEDPMNAKVGVNVQYTPSSLNVFSHLQPTMAVHTTAIHDTSNVFITKYAPGMSAYPFPTAQTATSAISSIAQSDIPTTTTMTMKLKDDKAVSLCGRVDFSSSQRGKALFSKKARARLRQSSALSIDIAFYKNCLVCPVSFPAPVLKETTETHIVFKESYITVDAPLADPLDSRSLSSFIYPITLGEGSIPTLLNSSHVNLDSLPILDTKISDENANKWVTRLISCQFSVREREIRDSKVGMTSRVNFKDSIFSMFTLALGLHANKQTNLFVLDHPKDGIQAIVIIRSVRLHGAEGSIVADAAVIPATRRIIDSKDIKLVGLAFGELENISKITVDDEEVALWKHVLPVFAERCRTWSHTPDCEYKKSGATIPLSTEKEMPYLCSCGQGKIPKDFITLPNLGALASKHATRIAISPTFSVPFVEDIVDLD